MKRSVLVTGASGNLGKAVTAKFLNEGFRVAALVSPRSASALEDSDDLKVYVADLLDGDLADKTVHDIFTGFGKLDAAILTVGGFEAGNLPGTGVEGLERMYRLNFLTAFTVARQVFKGMSGRKGGGQVVFIGALPALHPEQAKEMVAYSLSKSLLFRLAEIINEEGRSKEIFAGVIVPGIMDTPQNRSAMPDADFTKWTGTAAVADRIYRLCTEEGRSAGVGIIEV